MEWGLDVVVGLMIIGLTSPLWLPLILAIIRRIKDELEE